MPYEPFEKICKYYLDYIIEDSTDSLSVFATGRTLSYMEINNPELSNRENNNLQPDEVNGFHHLYTQQTAGNQIKSWWYGFPSLVRFKTAQSGWRGGILKPLFVVNLEVNEGIPNLIPTTPRINNDAFREMGLDLEQTLTLADRLGLFSDDNYAFNLLELTSKLQDWFPNLQIVDLPNGQSFSGIPYNDQIFIYNKGIIFATEASKITQGLEKELKQIKNSSPSQIQQSSIAPLFPELHSIPTTEQLFDLSEAIELNEQQRETVLSAFRNKLTVVTGPPGTGKSQVVASIVINGAKNGQRVLVASRNHKAVDVVEERLNQFADRPFIIRLGRKGSDDRNIQQQLLQYLNGLLGTVADRRINQELVHLQDELKVLYSNKQKLISQIEDYRNFRNDLSKYSIIWENLSNSLGSKNADLIFNKCCSRKMKYIDRLKLFFSKDWKNIFIYTQLLKKANEKIDLEYLTLKLTQIELQIRKKSRDEFVLWLNDLPSRLDGNKRATIGDFVAVLGQIIDGDNNTPRNVWGRLYGNRDRLMQSLSGFLPAWCVTNLSARGQLPLIESFFDLVIIDEASQCDIASAIPLMFRAKRAVIIGDLNQLTHISTLKTGRSLTLMHNCGLTDPKHSIFEATKNSLYHLAASRSGNNNIIMLNEHFRSHEDIITYSNKTWYSGNLDIGTDYNRLNPQLGVNEKAVEWIDVGGNIQQIDGSGAFISSEVNKVVEEVIKLVQKPNVNYTVGVVTPFRLQANKIRQSLINQLLSTLWDKTELLVDTAVKFQGDERDVMIFSPVITTNMPRGIRYYHESEYNLLNVAITRARAKLIIIGNLNASLHCGITYIQNFARYVSKLNNGNDGKALGADFESQYEEILYNALLSENIQTIPQYNFDQYRLDLAYLDNNKKIDIEVDGKSYHSDWTGERIKQDIIRNRKLQKKGWTILRFWTYEIRDNKNYCISKIQKTIRG